MESNKVKLVEIIRYGSESLGVSKFGIFTGTFDDILQEVKKYNDYRGGKYPEFFITEFELDKELAFATTTKRFDVDGNELDLDGRQNQNIDLNFVHQLLSIP